VVFVLWGKPAMEDLDEIEQHVAMTVAKTGGPIVFIARIPENEEPPDAEVRKAVSDRLDGIFSRSLSYHVVMEGSGFFNSMKRSALAAIFFATGKKKKVFVHASVDEVPVVARGEDVAIALGKLRERGYFTRRCWVTSPAPPSPIAGPQQTL
jgi:hypothetical protein